MRTIAPFCSSVNSTHETLLAANARLQALRAERQQVQGGTRPPVGEAWPQEESDEAIEVPTVHSAEQPSQTSGWLDSLREGVENPIRDISKSTIETYLDDPIQVVKQPTHITTFGTLTAAILKHDGGTVGRVWLVLRANFAGERQSGMVSADELNQCLSEHFPQYSQRHLRDLLNRGEGIYWQRDSRGRLWLTGITALAERLDIERLQGTRVIIPLADLTGKLARMRTALQAAFHASRNSDNPISRATLRDLTGISERSQREQERQHAELIEAKANYCLDGRIDQECIHEHAFRYRQSAFQFTDFIGKQGDAGDIHLAHQLPNSYTARYQCASRGRKRKINRQLNRVTQGARGTEWQQIEGVFYDNGAKAVRQLNSGAEEVIYQTLVARHGTRIWVTL